MNFNVYVDSIDAITNEYITEAIITMNAHQNAFRLIDMRGTIENQQICNCLEMSISNRGMLMNEKAKDKLSQLNISNRFILITEKRFDDNYFAHQSINHRIVTVSDWEEMYAPPRLDKFIQYEAIQLFIICAARLNGTQIRQICYKHLTASDCLFDFCQFKNEVKIGIRNGRICPECDLKIREFGVSDSQMQAIYVLLKLMTGKATFANVFIVHGHGEYRYEVKSFIEELGIKPIILSEQSNRGRTIIEKFEDESAKADFAIILYTPDDVGGKYSDSLKPRARQNVVFEHGYFTAKLGRSNVVVLLKNNTEETRLETAGDNDGIIYVAYDDNGGWKGHLKDALKVSGYRVNHT